MKPEEQQIVIAEACGWTEFWETERQGWRSQNPDGSGDNFLPDYLSDLNAMHEAVKTLPQNIKPRYFACLCSVVSGAISLYGYSEATEATAAKRAEAFLKALELWDEAHH